MRAWLRRGAAAASLAGVRGDLWPAGTLASLAYVGWLPLLLAVAPPDAHDLAFVGVSLVTSGSYPANVIALSVAAVGGFLLFCLLAAIGEVALSARLRARRPAAEPRMSLSALAIVLAAGIPAMAAAVVLLTGIIAQAPAAYTSPDVDTPVLVQLALAVMPQIVLVLLAILVGQAFGGVALRLMVREAGHETGASIRGALGRLVRSPWGPLGIATASWLKDLLLVGLTYWLLRLLWLSIEDSLGSGLLDRPETVLLLVGFVAIWLVLLLVAGVLHAAISAWWLAEVLPGDTGGRG